MSNIENKKNNYVYENGSYYDEYGNPYSYYCHDDGDAAHIDGGKDNPGLFTAK